MRIGIAVGLLTVVCTIRSVNAKQTYFYEKQNYFGLGRPIYRRSQQILDLQNSQSAYPDPIPPVPKSPKALVASPYRTVYQGNRVTNDTRVFRRRFDFDPILQGHQVLCEGLFDCTLTHLAIETSEAIPYIIRGGAGYRHFSVVVKARPGHALKGSVRAYCRQKDVSERDALGATQYSGKKFRRYSESGE